MPKIVSLQSGDFFPFIETLLAGGQSTKITVTGRSMFPFLRDAIDSVQLSAADFSQIRKGDIVLIQRDNQEYILHRVIRKSENSIFILGDYQILPEGPIRPAQLLARVTTVWRQNKKINCSGTLWRVLSLLWVYFLPFRRILIKVFAFINKIQIYLTGVQDG